MTSNKITVTDNPATIDNDPIIKGQIYNIYEKYYIVAECGPDMYVLINLSTGMRWIEPVHYDEIHKIFGSLTACKNAFRLVKNKTIQIEVGNGRD